jgi:hypothetical protein
MGFGWSTVSAVRTAALAAAVLALATTARADCLSDIGNALLNTANAVGSPECETAFSESPEVVTALAALLAADSSVAGQVCNAVYDLEQWGPTLASSLWTALQAAGSPVDIAQCACDISQGLGQLPSDAGACIEGFFCGAANFVGNLTGLGNQCQTCTPPPPVMANCTPPDCTECRADPSRCNGCNNLLEGYYDPNSVYGSVVQQHEADGSTLVMWQSGSQCTAAEYCFCPSPMTVQTNWEYDPSGDQWYYISCQCPKGTHLAGQPGQQTIPVCICNDTGRPAQPAGSVIGICPNLLGKPCPPGEENIQGRCVTPCPNPAQVQLADGTCCDPSQTAACGLCCPAGQHPDPVTGNCAAASHPVPIRLRPLRPR